MIQLGEYRLEMKRRGAICRLCHGAGAVLVELSWPVDARQGAGDENGQLPTELNPTRTSPPACAIWFRSFHYLRTQSRDSYFRGHRRFPSLWL